MNLTQEHDADVSVLRSRMDTFYSSCSGYPAFEAPDDKPEEWNYVRETILDCLQKQTVCRVLEFGAGRSRFAGYLGDLRTSVHFSVQDVTATNKGYLETCADKVEIGPLAGIRGSFDVIFSTFVLEHVTDPERSLEILLRLLKPGGNLLLFCPRYDVPFYISHSADHYGWLSRTWIGIYVCWRRIMSWATGKPAFLIHTDPAILHLDWSIDRDAIHWVSMIDLQAFFRGRGRIQGLSIRSGGLKDWFVKKCLRINIRFTATLLDRVEDSLPGPHQVFDQLRTPSQA